MNILFRKIKYLDRSAQSLIEGELLVQDGKIADFGPSLGAPEGAEIIEAEGAILCPGLVDMRAAIGEPGYEYRESVSSAAKAAAAGGITTIAVLPETNPVIDDPALVHFLRARGEETGSITLLPYAAATRGLAGKELAEYGLLQQAGAVAFTDGSKPIASSRLMRLALSYASGFGACIVQHPEDAELARGGAATAGPRATWMGLPAIPAAAEAICVARDIRLAELTGGALHFAHITTAEALDLIRRAKEKGLKITCDTAPPYFDLNETAIGDYRTYAKLSPPLRVEADRQAVVAGLKDGTIDAIASDHQPRDADDKRLTFADAEPGGAGLATLLGVTLARVQNGDLPLAQALALLTAKPAAWLGIDAGVLAKGRAADLCLFHPEKSWQVQAGSLPGKAQNTPFDGRALEGVVLGTWKAGRRVYG
ncbi:dihydroorotase [Acidocella aminolytica]|uniref:Dihydroorotase n=1 Tax=Acidocella aminolytica 101 = DSM 11237 TaxID=1120923 RepID=A0A0D6PDL7_9PROT|nr:dihydroorotase [Acidocella aminolytica]GAN79451.1 dihydroorotase [Acidocella aminolytica 101 = DSM 11237]SHE46183.1 dihydroorotase [Acidocella aminolytica 101 = DSM 11237]